MWDTVLCRECVEIHQSRGSGAPKSHAPDPRSRLLFLISRFLHRGEKIAEARDGWFVDSGADLVVLDPKKFAHPERYISLADYKTSFDSRLKPAK